MPKTISRKGIVKKLDKVVSDIVILRDGKCVVCGSTSTLGAGHIFSRKAHNTRWDMSEMGNVHCQCWPCNLRHVRDQYPYFQWYINKFGQTRFDQLRREFKTTRKYKTFELIELWAELVKILDKP
jgi:hypothetical protein